MHNVCNNKFFKTLNNLNWTLPTQIIYYIHWMSLYLNNKLFLLEINTCNNSFKLWWISQQIKIKKTCIVDGSNKIDSSLSP